MSAKVQIQFEFRTIKCINCGVPFGIADYHQSALRESHQNFYCPNGHPQHYPQENTEERLRRELKEEQGRFEVVHRRAEFYRRNSEEKERIISNLEAKAKRVKTRISNGVCPCCNRTFKQVAAHMKRKHPTYRDK